MKISSYSYVYSGLNRTPYYAAAMDSDESLWAAASSDLENGAMQLIVELETLDRKFGEPMPPDVDESFAHVHTNLQRTGLLVSAAGGLLDHNNMHLFNIGNARGIVFVDGYMCFHTDDHSESYEAYMALNDKTSGDYDRLRNLKGRLALTRGIGRSENPHVQFYPPIAMQKNTAVLFCTERFWHYLSIIEMEMDYRKAAGPEEWLKIMARRVLMKAGPELDDDNFAAVTVMVED